MQVGAGLKYHQNCQEHARPSPHPRLPASSLQKRKFVCPRVLCEHFAPPAVPFALTFVRRSSSRILTPGRHAADIAKPARASSACFDLHVACLHCLHCRLFSSSAGYARACPPLRAACSPCLHPHAGLLTRGHVCHPTCMPSGRPALRRPAYVCQRQTLRRACATRPACLTMPYLTPYDFGRVRALAVGKVIVS